MQSNQRIEGICKTIHFKKNYCIALKKRLHLIKSDYSNKSEFEKNEIDILSAETMLLLFRENSSCEKNEQMLQSDLNEFYEDLEELSVNYEKTIELAKKEQKENIEIKHLLYHVNWKFINNDIEEKIKFYKNLKQLLC